MNKLSLNSVVKVKLTDNGLKILENKHKQFNSSHEFKPPEVDEHGYSSFQLWALMSIFGEHIASMPFESHFAIDDNQLITIDDNYEFSQTTEKGRSL